MHGFDETTVCRCDLDKYCQTSPHLKLYKKWLDCEECGESHDVVSSVQSDEVLKLHCCNHAASEVKSQK